MAPLSGPLADAMQPPSAQAVLGQQATTANPTSKQKQPAPQPATHAKEPPAPYHDASSVPNNFFADYHRESINSDLLREAQGAGRDAQAADGLKPPKMYEMPKPPVTPYTNPVKAFGSIAMVLAGLGSLLTRQPLITALNSATKVLNAYKQNDASAAQFAFNEWKVSTANAIKMNDFQIKEYQAAIQKEGVDIRAKTAQVRALAAAGRDQVMQEEVQQRGLQGAERLNIERARLTAKLAGHAHDATVENAERQAYIDWNQKNPNATPIQKAEMAKKIYAHTLRKVGHSLTESQRYNMAKSAYNELYPVGQLPGTLYSVHIDPKTGKQAPPYDEWMKNKFPDIYKGIFDPDHPLSLELLPPDTAPQTTGAPPASNSAGAPAQPAAASGSPPEGAIPIADAPTAKGQPQGTILKGSDGKQYKVDGEYLVPVTG